VTVGESGSSTCSLTIGCTAALEVSHVIARVLRVDVDPQRVDAIVDAYQAHVRPIHVSARGLRQHYVLVDREAGRIEIIGVWDSAEAIAAIAPELEPARAALWAAFGQDPPLQRYEVADVLR
jgi:hypothetical protein